MKTSIISLNNKPFFKLGRSGIFSVLIFFIFIFVLICDRRKGIKIFFGTYLIEPAHLSWLFIMAEYSCLQRQTGCFSSGNNRSNPICHLFTPGWMWVEMLQVKSGACQFLFSFQKLHSPSVLSLAEQGQSQ